jgi:hypothetical protein
MNISDFIITVTFSLLTGVGLGLVIKDLWSYLTTFLVNRKSKKTNALKSVNFSNFFQSR